MSFLQLVADSWANLLSGLGTTQDRQRYTRYLPGHTPDVSELTEAYRSNWLARRVVDGLPERALARPPNANHAWPEAFVELNWANPQWDEGAFQRSINLGRLYGGAALIIGFSGGGEDLTQPAPTSGGVVFLDVVTRYELKVAQGPDGRPWRDYNPRSPNYRRPVVWELCGDHPRRGLRIHASRMIFWGGASRPPRAYQSSYSRPDSTGAQDECDWSDSVLLAPWEDIMRYGTMWQHVGQLTGVASVGIMKMRGLMAMLSQKSLETVRQRIDILNTGLSNARVLFLDSEGGEDYDRKGVSFAGLPELLQENALAVAGACQRPVTELFGRAPAGLNATGESDLRQWYDTVAQWRERVLLPRANRLASAIAGRSVKLEFPPVYIPTESEDADLRLKELQGNEVQWRMGLFSEDELRAAAQANEWVELHAKGGSAPEPEPPPPQLIPGGEPEDDGDQPPPPPR